MSGSLWWIGTSPEALVKGKSFDSAAGVEDAQGPPRVLPVLNQKFFRVSCGGAHALALTRDGKLFAWGWNEHGQLGFGDPTLCVRTPRLVGYFTGRVVGSIACGAAHSMALVAMDSQRLNVDVRCFTWGAHAVGQLGLPSNMLDAKLNPRFIALNTTHPQEVEAVNKLPGAIASIGDAVIGAVLDNDGIVQPQPISCGGAHSAMLTKDGALYTWGSNTHGQCGRNTQDSMPAQVLGLAQHKLIAVACGGAHTLALTDQGRLYSFGLNATGQLGDGNHTSDPCPQPSKVCLSVEIVISAISCGEEYSAAITNDGRLLTWGFGGCGQLGHGSVTSLRLPRQVACEAVAQVGCGMGVTVARTSSGGLLQFGYTGDWKAISGMDAKARQRVCACFPQVVNLADEAYQAQADVNDSAAPLHAYDVAVGRSFVVFVGAAIPPMAESDAIALIQRRFRSYELRREKKATLQAEAAAAIITGKASMFLARRAFIGAQIEIEQRRREVAVVRIQARQRERNERATLDNLRRLQKAADHHVVIEADTPNPTVASIQLRPVKNRSGANILSKQASVASSVSKEAKRVGGGFCNSSAAIVAPTSHRTSRKQVDA